MRTIIAGSRNCTDMGWLMAALATCPWRPTVVLSGAARGADQLGELWAYKNKITIERYPADWDTLGERAFYVRNEEMTNKADALIALWDGVSPDIKHMIDIAKHKGLQVCVQLVNNV